MGICKLTLKTYSDNTFSSEKGEFISTINPTNLRIYNNIVHSSFNTIGNNNYGIRFNSSQPRELSFSLLLDNTGIFPNSQQIVKNQLESLEGLLSKYQENIHEPYYVRVIWGNIDFKGKLSKMTIDYTSFKNDGTPIRAQVDIKIIEYINPDLNDKSSTSSDSDKDNSNNNADNNSDNNNNKANNDDKKDNGEGKKEQADNKVEKEENKDNKDEDNSTNADSDQEDKKEEDKSEENKSEEEKKEEDKKEEEKSEENKSEENKKEEEKSEEDKSEEKKEQENDEDTGNKEEEAAENDSGEKNKDNETKNNNNVNSKNEITDKINTKSKGPGIFSKIKSAGSSLVSAIQSKAGDSFPGLLKRGLLALGLGLKTILDLIKAGICAFAAFNILNTLRKLALGFVAFIKKLWDIIKSLVKKAVSAIKRGFTYIKNKIKSRKNKKDNKNTKKQEPKKQNKKSWWQRMKEKFRNAKNKIKEKFKNIKNKSKNRINKIKNKAKTKRRSIFNRSSTNKKT